MRPARPQWQRVAKQSPTIAQKLFAPIWIISPSLWKGREARVTLLVHSPAIVNIDNDLYEGALDVLERLHDRFVVGTRLHFHELVEFQRGRCGDDMKCVRPDQEMRALYRFLRRHPCIGLALDPVRGGRPRAQPVVFVVARTECE